MPPGLLEKQYQDWVSQGRLDVDPAQIHALKKLQTLQLQLCDQTSFKPKAIMKKWRRPAQCRNIYLFGEVGRGKSMLMNMFFQSCPTQQKRRVHFHAFMLELHNFVHHWQNQGGVDAISALAEHLSSANKLLCLDEFHISDIADAMLIAQLFGKLFESGLAIVTTSNFCPTELYQGGLQRELVLPFIKILQESAEVVELSGTKDYRKAQSPSENNHYYYPLDSQASEFAKQQYNHLTDWAPIQPETIQVLSRQIKLTAVSGNIALASFQELCAQPLGSVDYLVISRHFETLILTNIPKLTPENRNEAKRFITLIDILYEHKVKLICTAEVPLNELYDTEDILDFRRTLSRLFEMQSTQYLALNDDNH